MRSNCWAATLVCLLPIVAVVECSWGAPGDGQYHIQTDEGPERYFRFQTDNGQFRKEKRLQDGTVIGTEAWIDAAGFLRQTDYIADKDGYRILKSKTIFVGHGRHIEDAIKSTKSVPAQSGILVDGSAGLHGHSNSVAAPSNAAKHGGYVYSTTTPATPSTTANPPLPTVPAASHATDGKLNYLSPAEAADIAPTPNLGFDHYPDELPRLHAQNYERQHQPVVQIRPHADPLDDAHSNIIGDDYQVLGGTTAAPPPPQPALSMQPPFESRGAGRRRVRPIAVFATAPPPIAGNAADAKNDDGYSYSTPAPAPFLGSPPVSSSSGEPGYYYQRATTARPQAADVVPLEVNQLEDGLLPPLPRPVYRRVHPTQQPPNSVADVEYDGVGVTRNGFRYFLPRHYHEEEQFDGDKRAGSYGYVDPFGIRRVVYYNASPGRGFVHRNNNRYVGLGATPYDPVAT